MIEPDIIKPEKNFTSKKNFKSLALGKKELSSEAISAKTSMRSQIKSFVNSKIKKTPEPEEEKKSSEISKIKQPTMKFGKSL